MCAVLSRLELLRIDSGLPQKLPKKPLSARCIGSPHPILKAKRHQRTTTIAKPTNDIIIVYTDPGFCITPPYKAIRPGMLIRPTNVAAVNCQALLPVSTAANKSIASFLRRGQAPGMRLPRQSLPARAPPHHVHASKDR